MRQSAIILTAVLFGVAAAAPPPPPKKTPEPAAKKAASPGPAKPAPAKRVVAAPASGAPRAQSAAPKAAAARPPAASRYSRSWTPAKASVRAAPAAPMQPSPERITEIQQALAAKGYYAGPLNGVWGPDSVDALRRFQKDHNLRDDGKLSSLSLISLGLGPTRPASDPKTNPDPEK